MISPDHQPVGFRHSVSYSQVTSSGSISSYFYPSPWWGKQSNFLSWCIFYPLISPVQKHHALTGSGGTHPLSTMPWQGVGEQTHSAPCPDREWRNKPNQHHALTGSGGTNPLSIMPWQGVGEQTYSAPCPDREWGNKPNHFGGVFLSGNSSSVCKLLASMLSRSAGWRSRLQCIIMPLCNAVHEKIKLFLLFFSLPKFFSVTMTDSFPRFNFFLSEMEKYLDNGTTAFCHGVACCSRYPGHSFETVLQS